jgi:hypothetical protein
VTGLFRLDVHGFTVYCSSCQHRKRRHTKLARCYGRNGVRGWTIEDQRKVLADGGWLDEYSLFLDELPAHRAKNPGRVQPEWLVVRDEFMRRTSRRGETVVVATPLALAVSQRDLTQTLATLVKNRSATVLFADSGISIPPDAGMAGADVAIGAWQDAMKKATTKTSRIAGNVAATAAKKRLTAEKKKIAEPLWPLPTEDISSEEIAQRSGLSVKTLYNELGPRSIAQLKLVRSQRRKSRGKN